MVKNGVQSKMTTDLGASYLGRIRSFATAHDVDWGLAGSGYSDEAGRDDPAWLSHNHGQIDAYGGVAFAHSDAELDSISTLQIAGGPKLEEYASALATAPTLS